MIQKIFLMSSVVIFIAAFIIKNIGTYMKVNRGIRGDSYKMKLSVFFSALLYILVILNVLFKQFQPYFLPISLLEIDVLRIIGYFMIFLAIIMGIWGMVQMKDSWRVGIIQDQKTNLVINGIFGISRNPYFLSYNLFFGAFFVVFPSWIYLFLFITVVIFFHLMIVEEEIFLEKEFKMAYKVYKSRVRRYIGLKGTEVN